MRKLQCTVLPVGWLVELDVPENGLLREEVLTCLSRCFNHPTEQFQLFSKSEKGLSTLSDCHVDQNIFALVRVHGGGKGGFRKQLEKKGREFSRAKEKRDKAKKNPTKPKKHTRVSSASLPTPTNQLSAKTLTDEATSLRLLAAQGVSAALRKYQKKK